MAGGTRTPGDSLLARTARILRTFTADEPELQLGELAERAELPRTTAHRIAGELVQLGFLERVASGGYAIGAGLWELGELSVLSLRLREVALPHLLKLYEATVENVHLAVLDGALPEEAQALYVARITGPRAIPTLSRMGGRHPLHTTGVGKALLSSCDEEWLGRYFTSVLEPETTFSVTSEAALRSELELARARGYATTRQEMTLGNVSIAAPLPVVEGLPPVAVGVVTHIARADERRVAPVVVRTAIEIAESLGRFR